jgi:hypothetical protein
VNQGEIMQNRVTLSKRIAVLVTVIIGLVASAPAYAITEECPTWFPDFQCERSGRYDGFVMPISHPYLFEDPFITTGINLVGIWHDYPRSSAFQGGHGWVVAAQARVAVTDRLAFIATKDGYMWSKPGNNALKNTNGFLNIAAGLKYALIDDRENNFILTPRLVIEIPVGNDDVYSGRGDGIAITGVSSGYRIGDLNILGDFGFQVPFSRVKQTTSMLYHLHLSYTLMEHFVPLVELNGHHYLDSGDGGTKVHLKGGGKARLRDIGANGFEAVDVTNLGQKSVAGNDLVTMAFGARFPITDHMSMGAAYEIPVTNRKDIFNQRVTWSFNFEY